MSDNTLTFTPDALEALLNRVLKANKPEVAAAPPDIAGRDCDTSKCNLTYAQMQDVLASGRSVLHNGAVYQNAEGLADAHLGQTPNLLPDALEFAKMTGDLDAEKAARADMQATIDALQAQLGQSNAALKEATGDPPADKPYAELAFAQKKAYARKNGIAFENNVKGEELDALVAKWQADQKPAENPPANP